MAVLASGRAPPELWLIPTVFEVAHEHCNSIPRKRRTASVSAATSTFLAMMIKAFRLHLLLDSVDEKNKRCLELLIGFSFFSSSFNIEAKEL
jgi:hypothetical protein